MNVSVISSDKERSDERFYALLINSLRSLVIAYLELQRFSVIDCIRRIQRSSAIPRDPPTSIAVAAPSIGTDVDEGPVRQFYFFQPFRVEILRYGNVLAAFECVCVHEIGYFTPVVVARVNRNSLVVLQIIVAVETVEIEDEVPVDEEG